MRDIRNLFLAVILLTFVGGVGTGAWLGSLRAAPDQPNKRNIDRRMEDWNRVFQLDASQTRRLRGALQYYEAQRERIRQDAYAEQGARVLRLKEECREKVREILTPEQRAEYDARRRPDNREQGG